MGLCVCGGERAGQCACVVGRGQDSVRVWWAEGRTVCVCGGQRAGQCACVLGKGQDITNVPGLELHWVAVALCPN